MDVFKILLFCLKLQNLDLDFSIIIQGTNSKCFEHQIFWPIYLLLIYSCHSFLLSKCWSACPHVCVLFHICFGWSNLIKCTAHNKGIKCFVIKCDEYQPHLKVVKTCPEIEVPPTHLKHNYCTETRVLDFADGSVQL